MVPSSVWGTVCLCSKDPEGFFRLKLSGRRLWRLQAPLRLLRRLGSLPKLSPGVRDTGGHHLSLRGDSHCFRKPVMYALSPATAKSQNTRPLNFYMSRGGGGGGSCFGRRSHATSRTAGSSTRFRREPACTSRVAQWGKETRLVEGSRSYKFRCKLTFVNDCR